MIFLNSDIRKKVYRIGGSGILPAGSFPGNSDRKIQGNPESPKCKGRFLIKRWVFGKRAHF